MAVYMTLRRGLRRTLKRVRVKIAHRKAIILQAIWRMAIARYYYHTTIQQCIKIQTRIRMRLAIHRIKLQRINIYAIKIQKRQRGIIGRSYSLYRRYMGCYLAEYMV